MRQIYIYLSLAVGSTVTTYTPFWCGGSCAGRCRRGTCSSGGCSQVRDDASPAATGAELDGPGKWWDPDEVGGWGAAAAVASPCWGNRAVNESTVQPPPTPPGCCCCIHLSMTVGCIVTSFTIFVVRGQLPASPAATGAELDGPGKWWSPDEVGWDAAANIYLSMAAYSTISVTSYTIAGGCRSTLLSGFAGQQRGALQQPVCWELHWHVPNTVLLSSDLSTICHHLLVFCFCTHCRNAIGACCSQGGA
jgi:hypothetical protein